MLLCGAGCSFSRAYPVFWNNRRFAVAALCIWIWSIRELINSNRSANLGWEGPFTLALAQTVGGILQRILVAIAFSWLGEDPKRYFIPLAFGVSTVVFAVPFALEDLHVPLHFG
jgi:hypothetical protein